MIAELESAAFEYALICDDVRREDNNKLILIGVYANNVVLQDFPATIRLRLVTRIHPKQREFALSFRVKVNDEPVLIFKGRLTSPAMDADTSPSPEFLVPIEGIGTIKVDVSDAEFDVAEADEAPWTQIFSIPVARAAET
jgi:hypothetical protein